MASKRVAERNCFDMCRMAFNEYHEQMNGQLRPGACDETAQFYQIKENTQVQYIVDVLPIVIEQLLLPQEDFLDACQMHAAEEDDDALRVLLDSGSFKQRTSFSQLCSSSQNGLLNINSSAMEAMVSRCSCVTTSGSKVKVKYNWRQVQHLFLLHFAASSAPIDLKLLREPFVFAKKPMVTASQLQQNEQLDAALPQIFLQPLPDSLHADLILQFGQQHYQETVQLLHSLALASHLLVLTESAAEIEQLSRTALSQFLHNLLPETKTACQLQVRKVINTLDVPGLKLAHLSEVHAVACKHLDNRGYLHTHLPQLLKDPLPREEHQQIDDAFKRLFNLERPAVISCLTEKTLQSLHNCVESATQHPDTPLANLLEAYSAPPEIIELIPQSVHGQHLAAVVSLVVQLSEQSWSETQRERIQAQQPWIEPSLQMIEEAERNTSRQNQMQPNRYEQMLFDESGDYGDNSAFLLDHDKDEMFVGPLPHEGAGETPDPTAHDKEDTYELIFSGLGEELEDDLGEAGNLEEEEAAEAAAAFGAEQEGGNGAVSAENGMLVGDINPKEPVTGAHADVAEELSLMLSENGGELVESATTKSIMEDCFSEPVLCAASLLRTLPADDNDVDWILSNALDTVPLLGAVSVGKVHLSIVQAGKVQPSPALQTLEKGVCVLHRGEVEMKPFFFKTSMLHEKAREKCKLDTAISLADSFGRVLVEPEMPLAIEKKIHLTVLTEAETVSVAVDNAAAKSENVVTDGDRQDNLSIKCRFALKSSLRDVLRVALQLNDLPRTSAGLHLGDGLLLSHDSSLADLACAEGTIRLTLVTGPAAVAATCSNSSGDLKSLPPKQPILLSHVSNLLPSDNTSLVIRPNPQYVEEEEMDVHAVLSQHLRKLCIQAEDRQSWTVLALSGTPIASIHQALAGHLRIGSSSTTLTCGGLPLPLPVSVGLVSCLKETTTLKLVTLEETCSVEIELGNGSTKTCEVTSTGQTVQTILGELTEELSMEDLSVFSLVDKLTSCSLPSSLSINNVWSLKPSPQLALLPTASLCPLVLMKQFDARRRAKASDQVHMRILQTGNIQNLLSHLQWLDTWQDLFTDGQMPVVRDRNHILLPGILPVGQLQLLDDNPTLLVVLPAQSVSPITLNVVHDNLAPFIIQTDFPDVPVGNVINFLAPLLEIIASNCLLLGQCGDKVVEFICEDRCPVSEAVTYSQRKSSDDGGTEDGTVGVLKLCQDENYLAAKTVTIELTLLTKPEDVLATFTVPLAADLSTLLEEARDKLHVSTPLEDLDLVVAKDESSMKKKLLSVRQAFGIYNEPLKLLLQAPQLVLELLPFDEGKESVRLELASNTLLEKLVHVALDALHVDMAPEHFNLSVDGVEFDLDYGMSLYDCADEVVHEEGTPLKIELLPKEKAAVIIVHIKDKPIKKELHMFPWIPLSELAAAALSVLEVSADITQVQLSVQGVEFEVGESFTVADLQMMDDDNAPLDVELEIQDT